VKPTIVHILNDRHVGGVTATLQSLLTSPLQEHFTLSTLTTSEALTQLRQLRPAMTVWHEACAWRTLPTLARLRRASRLLIHEHHYCAGFERWNVSARRRFHWMLRCAYGLSHRVVAVSHAQAAWMQRAHLVSAHKVTTIQQCRTLTAFRAVPDTVATPPYVLGVYGRFCQQKGLDTVLRALQRIPQQPLRLLVGGYGEDEAMLRALAGADPRITFVGMLTDVPAFLRQCDAVLIPSRWEPWGNVWLEVKAAGKPAIVSQVDGLTEQMADCGMLAPPDDVQAWADAVTRLCALDPQTLHQWGHNGRQAIAGAWEHYVASWEAAYWHLLETSS
jgi:glycosyltransferase involved in cell wall biosynthesis